MMSSSDNASFWQIRITEDKLVSSVGVASRCLESRSCRREGKRTGQAADLRLLQLWRHLVVAFKKAAQTYNSTDAENLFNFLFQIPAASVFNSKELL